MHPRIQQDIGAHYPTDCARRADHRHRRLRIGTYLQRRCRNAAQDVENYEAHRPHRVLDIVAEDPQEPHIADNVEPSTVHEHGRKDCRPARRGAEFAPGVGTELNLCAGRHGSEQLARNQPQLANGPCQQRIRAQPLHENPHENVDGYDAERCVGNEDLRIVVSDREHVRFPPAV